MFLVCHRTFLLHRTAVMCFTNSNPNAYLNDTSHLVLKFIQRMDELNICIWYTSRTQEGFGNLALGAHKTIDTDYRRRGMANRVQPSNDAKINVSEYRPSD